MATPPPSHTSRLRRWASSAAHEFQSHVPHFAPPRPPRRSATVSTLPDVGPREPAAWAGKRARLRAWATSAANELRWEAAHAPGRGDRRARLRAWATSASREVRGRRDSMRSSEGSDGAEVIPGYAVEGSLGRGAFARVERATRDSDGATARTPAFPRRRSFFFDARPTKIL